ncbi:hypothetical protein GW17_00038979, partial [Ensete ventricosum]
TGEVDYFGANIRLREPGKSEDKVEKASVRREVDSEECCIGRSTDCEERNADARQQTVGPWAGSAMVPERRDFSRVIDPSLS